MTDSDRLQLLAAMVVDKNRTIELLTLRVAELQRQLNETTLTRETARLIDRFDLKAGQKYETELLFNEDWGAAPEAPPTE